MTRSEIETAIYRRLGKNVSSIDTTTQTRIRHFVNRRYRRLLADAGWRTTTQTITLSSVASQSRYVLPAVDRILAFRDLTNDRPLDLLSVGRYRQVAADPTAAPATPSCYVVHGYEAVAKQPSNASELFLDSSSASDTQVAYAEVDITGGYPRSLSVTLTGTTAVSLSSSVTTVIRVRKLYLASAAVGVVTLHEDADGGTELARIGIGQTTQRYLVVDLWPQPSAVVSYEIDVEVPVTNLAQDTDEPMLPERFHDLLELGAAMDEYGKTGDDRYILMDREYKALHSEWVYWVALQTPSQPVTAEWSTLGAYFPHGT